MTETVRISPLPPARPSLSHAALREGGIELIRRLAAETWTDHNVHDPGITFLETFCYAMTELGFRIQLDVADLLRSGEAQAPAELVPAHRALPSGPVTADDLRRVLLDHPLVGDASVTPVTGGEARGLFEVVLTFAERELNDNGYPLSVTSGGVGYSLDLALPRWDDAEAVPFRRRVTIDGVQMVDPGGGVWRSLDEPRTFFGEIRVAYTGPDGSGTIDLWVLMRIATELAQPALATPGVLAAARAAIETSAVLVEPFAERVRRASAAVDRVRRWVSSWRPLCAEPARLVAARVQEIAVGARIEVAGGADLERLLAEIFLDVDLWLSPPIRFHSLDELLAAGRSVEEIFDGPTLRHGFLDDEELAARARPSRLFVSDVLRLIMRRRRAEGGDLVAQENPSGRDIVAVTDLRLSTFVNNRPVTVDARDCLRLVDVDVYRPRLSLAKSRIVFVRDEVEVAHDPLRVASLYDGMRRETLASVLPDDPSPELAAVPGEVLPVDDYFPFQNDLPRVYGVGEHGLPESAGVERKARALQTRGYLMPFEQLLADLTAQLASINRFFSADPEEPATYFSRPLFDLPGAPGLLHAFPPGGDWQAFVADPDNSYRRALREAAESRDRLLDRRNRMLDHLLARHGEEAVAWGQELHRQARRELLEQGLPSAELPDRLEERRRAVNARLIRAKAAFLADVPELAANRLQALDSPLRRRPEALTIEESAGGLRWVLDSGAGSELVAADGSDTPAAAAIAAEEAAVLASQPDFYEVFLDGSRRRYRLRAGAGTPPVGESRQTYTTITAARTAFRAAAASFAERLLVDARAPMERRIGHLTGIRSQGRRRLLVPLDVFFEIFPDGGGVRWRLWELPGRSGRELLASTATFPDAGAAGASIAQAVRWGIDEWSYAVSQAGDAFAVELADPAGAVVGRTPSTLPTRREAELAVAATVDHLYRSYGGEGLHLVEHLLLRPRSPGDERLKLPAGGGVEGDPYSHRLSLFLPSGHQRDFAAGPPVRTAAAPQRFRDAEFRRHAERMVQQSCPAHLLPTIYWVDREAPGTASSDASFDTFEERFFDWLETVWIPGAAPEVAATARNALVVSINAIADDAAAGS